jgi:hypothetical protein
LKRVGILNSYKRKNMFQILQEFEQTAARFSPFVLIAPGVAVVLIGLFTWLGGLGFRKVVVVVLGAVAGWVGGYFIAGRNVMAAAASALVAAVLAVVLQRVFITIFAALLAAVLTFFVFTGMCPEVLAATEEVPIMAASIVEQNVMISVGQTPVILKVYIADFTKMVQQAATHMPIYGWATMAGLALVFLIAGFCLHRFTSALCCAVFGAMLVFAGMIWLLLYKGSQPISRVCNKPLYYAAVFGAMVVFGTLIQLLIGPSLEGKGKRKRAGQDKSEPRKHGWRSS